MNRIPALPEHLQPAREFFDAIAHMLAQAVLDDLRQAQGAKPKRPRPVVKQDNIAGVPNET